MTSEQRDHRSHAVAVTDRWGLALSLAHELADGTHDLPPNAAVTAEVLAEQLAALHADQRMAAAGAAARDTARAADRAAARAARDTARDTARAADRAADRAARDAALAARAAAAGAAAWDAGADAVDGVPWPGDDEVAPCGASDAYARAALGPSWHGTADSLRTCERCGMTVQPYVGCRECRIAWLTDPSRIPRDVTPPDCRWLAGLFRAERAAHAESIAAIEHRASDGG